MRDMIGVVALGIFEWNTFGRSPVERTREEIAGEFDYRLNASAKAGYRNRARAAIVSLRQVEPNAEVMARLIRSYPVLKGGERLMAELWRAMIDAGLSSEPQSSVAHGALPSKPQVVEP